MKVTPSVLRYMYRFLQFATNFENRQRFREADVVLNEAMDPLGTTVQYPVLLREHRSIHWLFTFDVIACL
jgi:hypothetical protein